MKRFLITTATLLISSILLSQSFYTTPISKNVKKINGEGKTGYNIVFNYGFQLDSLLGGIANARAAYLWPDTTVILPNGSPNNIFAISENVNPYSPIFLSQLIGPIGAYYIEKIGIYGIYKREPQFQNAVDTLIVQVKLSPKHDSYWQQGTNPWVMSDYGTDTLLYRTNKIDATWPYTSDPNIFTFKYLLDSNSVNDTLENGVNYFQLPTHILTNGHTIPFCCAYEESMITVIFKPGFSWNANVDTITQVNRFRFISNEENGDAGGQGTLPSYTKRDYNTSYILHKDALYPKNNPTLFQTNDLPDSVFTPSYAFKAACPFEHHWIDVIYHIEVVGGVESKDQKGQIIVFPNPATDFLTIINQNPSDIVESIEIYDITGNCVMKPNPDETQKISISALSQGLYFARIVTESATHHTLKFVKK